MSGPIDKAEQHALRQVAESAFNAVVPMKALLSPPSFEEADGILF